MQMITFIKHETIVLTDSFYDGDMSWVKTAAVVYRLVRMFPILPWKPMSRPITGSAPLPWKSWKRLASGPSWFSIPL